MIFSTEDSTNKVIASSRARKVGSGSGVGDGDASGVWVGSAGGSEVGMIRFS